MESSTNAHFRSFSSVPSAITGKTVTRIIFAKASCVIKGDNYRFGHNHACPESVDHSV